MSEIHPTAIVQPGAEIGSECTIGPYSVIGSNVKLGSRNHIGSHVVIEGHTTIGDDNRIFQFASVGADPQDLKFHGEASTLDIGDSNIIREYVTLQPGTQSGGMRTEIGSRNLFMACCHVGHDSFVGSGNILANGAAIAGHVAIEDHVTVGGLVGVHQFVRLGNHSFLGAGAMVSQDIPPFCTAQGDRAELVGINTIGLQRHGFDGDEVKQLRKLFRDVFLGSGLLKDRLTKCRANYQHLESCSEFLDFITNSERGVAAVRKRGLIDDD
ncbi:MAG: acyl-ACP--UDP-N-acetylglucosamine O-acyltransferase [Bdellovibrionales bacterium]|nr:acyl-ACP--UDP-N-acetylglucosamine O-acyltransferase [Bdellovibrionales bacterium]